MENNASLGLLRPSVDIPASNLRVSMKGLVVLSMNDPKAMRKSLVNSCVALTEENG